MWETTEEQRARVDRYTQAYLAANARPSEQRTGNLESVGTQRLGLNQVFKYWRCVDCFTEYPQRPDRLWPTCNGCAIRLCPYCRPATSIAKTEIPR